jgi:hypothetical protein
VVRTGCRVEVAGNEQDNTTGRQAQGKQVGNVCRKRQAAEVAGKQQDKTTGRQAQGKQVGKLCGYGQAVG